MKARVHLFQKVYMILSCVVVTDCFEFVFKKDITKDINRHFTQLLLQIDEHFKDIFNLYTKLIIGLKNTF